MIKDKNLTSTLFELRSSSCFLPFFYTLFTCRWRTVIGYYGDDLSYHLIGWWKFSFWLPHPNIYIYIHGSSNLLASLFISSLNSVRRFSLSVVSQSTSPSLWIHLAERSMPFTCSSSLTVVIVQCYQQEPIEYRLYLG